MPLLRQHGLPLAKNVGKEIIQNVSSIAHDAIDGKDIKEGAKQKFKSSFEKLSQIGKGYKRKRIQSIKRNKKYKDIFSK